MHFTVIQFSIRHLTLIDLSLDCRVHDPTACQSQCFLFGCLLSLKIAGPHCPHCPHVTIVPSESCQECQVARAGDHITEAGVHHRV